MTAGGNVSSIRKSAAKTVTAPDLRDSDQDDDGDMLDRMIVPPDCPVTPLGFQGLKLWVLDAANQLLPVPTDCRKGDMTLLFGGDRWLTKQYPRFGKAPKNQPPPIVGFDQAEAQTFLITACHNKGIFNPQGRVFGRGAHRATEDDEQLVLHLGRSVLIAGQMDTKGKRVILSEHRPGEIGDAFFPAYEALPPPAAESSAASEAEALRDLFGRWYWVEKDASTLLLLGMSAQMHICGALKWRSHTWLAGPTAAGKTTLQNVIRAVHSKWCLHTEDASEAAIRQVLNDDTLPVMIDEAEKDDNPEKQRAILNLAKKASSGAKMHRGSADHQAREFTAQSCFLFSSVLHGVVKGEDRNRMAILNMREIPERSPWEDPDLKYWREAGRRMHRRMIDQWPRFNRTLADYKREIASHGFTGRWQDTFGTLLACADMLLHECAPSADAMANDSYGREKEWVRLILPMMMRGKVEARTDVERCLAHLMSRQLPGAHGASAETVGQWVVRAMKIADPETGGINHTARDRLKQYGLRVVTLHETKSGWGIAGEPIPDDWHNGYLAVAYGTCEPLEQLFKGTDWSGGAWLQSLGKIADARGPMKVRFAGPGTDNALAVPLRALKGSEEA